MDPQEMHEWEFGAPELVIFWCPSCEEEWERPEGADTCPLCHLTPLEKI